MSAFARIQNEVSNFTSRTGLAPNLLIVDTNFELSLNSNGIPTAAELWGMRILVCDTIGCGILVARTEQVGFMRGRRQ